MDYNFKIKTSSTHYARGNGLAKKAVGPNKNY